MDIVDTLNNKKNKTEILDKLIREYFLDIIHHKDEIVNREFYAVALYRYHENNEKFSGEILKKLISGDIADISRYDPFEKSSKLYQTSFYHKVSRNSFLYNIENRLGKKVKYSVDDIEKRMKHVRFSRFIKLKI